MRMEIVFKKLTGMAFSHALRREQERRPFLDFIIHMAIQSLMVTVHSNS